MGRDLDDEDEDDSEEANDDISAIGEVKDIRLSLFKTSHGGQLFGKAEVNTHNTIIHLPIRSDRDLLLSNTLQPISSESGGGGGGGNSNGIGGSSIGMGMATGPLIINTKQSAFNERSNHIPTNHSENSNLVASYI